MRTSTSPDQAEGLRAGHQMTFPGLPKPRIGRRDRLSALAQRLAEAAALGLCAGRKDSPQRRRGAEIKENADRRRSERMNADGLLRAEGTPQTISVNPLRLCASAVSKTSSCRFGPAPRTLVTGIAMTQPLPDDLVAFAGRLARCQRRDRQGATSAAGSGSRPSRTESVTLADREAEAAIRKLIGERHPAQAWSARSMAPTAAMPSSCGSSIRSTAQIVHHGRRPSAP